MNIIQSYLTKNACYIAGKKLILKGLMLHSVGCPQPSAQVFIRNWNTAKPGGAQVCVHAFVEPGGAVYQTLPWDMRAWHGGGESNNTYIGVEMTEPSTIRYTTGASWQETSDGVNTKSHVLGTYKTAVELFAYLCKLYGLNPLADGVIISHSEGAKRNIASSHADVEHLWNSFGLSMSQFRNDVSKAMGSPQPQPTKLYYIQVGAYSQKSNADNVAQKLKVKGYDANVSLKDGLYKVLTDAFEQRAEAQRISEKLKADGFEGAIVV